MNLQRSPRRLGFQRLHKAAMGINCPLCRDLFKLTDEDIGFLKQWRDAGYPEDGLLLELEDY